MVTKLSQKNKFGGYTYDIKLNSLFHILINGSDSDSYIVEFKEWKIFNFKVHLTFVSNCDLEVTIINAFDRIDEFIYKNNVSCNLSNKSNIVTNVLRILTDSKEITSKNMISKYDILLKTLRGISDKMITEEANNQIGLYCSDIDSTVIFLIREELNEFKMDYIVYNKTGVFFIDWQYEIGFNQRMLILSMIEDIDSLSKEIQLLILNNVTKSISQDEDMLSDAEFLWLLAFKAFQNKGFNAAKKIIEISLLIDKNNIQNNLLFLEILSTKENISQSQYFSNLKIASAHLIEFNNKISNNIISLDNIQESKLEYIQEFINGELANTKIVESNEFPYFIKEVVVLDIRKSESGRLFLRARINYLENGIVSKKTGMIEVNSEDCFNSGDNIKDFVKVTNRKWSFKNHANVPEIYVLEPLEDVE